jgi:signal transduction histidine kinase
VTDHSANGAEGDPINILIVEHHRANRVTYRAILEELGENILIADSARGALVLLLQHEVPLLLVDVVRPELDGLELVEMIRAHPRFEKTAVIFLSGVDQPDIDRIRRYLTGVVDYVPVPVVPELLRAKVRVFADGYRKTRQLERLKRGLEDHAARTADLEVEASRNTEFLATFAHELRNALSPVLSCVGLLKSGGLEPTSQARHQNILEGQVRHLVRLVEELLDVSRISRGAITLHSEPTDLAALVRATVDATLLRSSSHVIVTEFAEPGPTVSVDPVRMTQVISNILDNATKFTPAGEKILVRISADNGDVVLRIVDSGIGIASQDLDRVFELFTQVNRGRGLGVGLALARQLVDLQGGTVTAHSEGEGCGTEIIVRLPGLRDPCFDVTPVEPGTPAASSRSVRFLIVDDNVLLADTLAELLERSGYPARAAYSGDAASRVGEEFEPDIVLLDLGMPVVDGFEVAQRVRQASWGSRVKLVAVTGWGRTSDRKKTADAGFDRHLVKPVDLDDVLELVQLVES